MLRCANFRSFTRRRKAQFSTKQFILKKDFLRRGGAGIFAKFLQGVNRAGKSLRQSLPYLKGAIYFTPFPPCVKGDPYQSPPCVKGDPYQSPPCVKGDPYQSPPCVKGGSKGGIAGGGAAIVIQSLSLLRSHVSPPLRKTWRLGHRSGRGYALAHLTLPKQRVSAV